MEPYDDDDEQMPRRGGRGSDNNNNNNNNNKNNNNMLDHPSSKSRRFQPPKQRKQITLTLKLIQEIQASLTEFKPSKSLSMLTQLSHDYETKAAAEIDVVCSGGGMKAYFMTGCYAVLLAELEKRNIRIARAAGASAGAWAGLFICTGLGTALWIETYYRFKELEGATIHEAYTDMYQSWVRHILPEDAYKRCNGRLFISISFVTSYGLLENRIISEYTSNDDLIEACCASSTIPFITERYGLRRFRGQLVADGSFTNDLPVFKDGLRRQLVFRLYELDYSITRMATPTDDCIEGLILRGAMLMAQFLEGNRLTNAIAWLDTNESDRDLVKAKHNDILDRITAGLDDNKYTFLLTFLGVRYLLKVDSTLSRWLGAVGNAALRYVSELDYTRATTFIHTVVGTATSFIYRAVVNIYS